MVVGSELNLNHQTIQNVLTEELGMQKTCAKLDAASQQHSLSHCHLREQIFNQKGYSSGSTAPYSPDPSPCNFFLFLKLKFHLKGRHFGTVDNIQKVVTDQLKALSHEFQHCYQEQCLQQCVAPQGNYFDGDNVDW
jgi:hypothetical protein